MSMHEIIHPVQIEIFRKMSASDKFALIGKLFEDARQIKKAALRDRHPTWSEEQLDQAVTDIFIYGKYSTL